MVFFFLSFRVHLSSFTPSRPICLSYGLVIHYSCSLGLMDFLSIYQFFSVHVAGLLLSTWTSKMAINNRINSKYIGMLEFNISKICKTKEFVLCIFNNEGDLTKENRAMLMSPRLMAIM